MYWELIRIIRAIRSIRIILAIFAVGFVFIPAKIASAGFIVQRPLYIGLTNGLVGFWSFDGKDMNATQARDASGNLNHGTLTNGPTRQIGKIGQALNFDGSNDSMNTASTMSFGSKTITVSFWLYWNAFANNDSLAMELSTNYNNNDGSFFIDPNSATGSFELSIQDGSTPGLYRQETFTRPSAQAWHHYAFVFDNSTTAGDITVYVDSVLQSTTVSTNNKDQTSDFRTDTLYFMSRAGSSLFGAGKLDDVRIYNRALSAGEIKRLYKIGATAKIVKPAITKTNLTVGEGAWGASQTTASISPGPNRLVLAVIHSGSFDLNQTTTLSGAGMTWVQVARIATVNANILTVFRAMSATPGSGAVTITNSQNARSAWSFFELDGVDTSGTNGSGAIVQTGTITGLSATPGVTLGSFSGMGNATVGGFGLCNNGTDVFTPGTGFSKIHEQPESTGNCTRVATEWRADNDATVDGTIPSDNWLAFGAEIKAKPKSSSISSSQNSKITNGLVGLWSFNGPDMSGTTAYDRSGQGNNGTLTNGPTRQIGKIGQALSFDGSNDFVNMGNHNSDVTTYTVSVWFNKLGGSGGRVLFRGDSADCFYNPSIFVGSTIIVNESGCANEGLISDTVSVTNNTWYHVGLTRSGQKVLYFVNGVLITTDTSQPAGGTSGKFYIGAFHHSVNGDGGYFNGLIDDVRVYNRALSPDEIKRLYNMGR